MNVRVRMVMLVLADLQGTLIGNECACGAPLLVTPKLKTPFCWLCRTDELAALEGRAELHRLKNNLDVKRMKDSGIVLETRETYSFIL